MRKLILMLVLLLPAQLANADERILSYDSRIQILQDSHLEWVKSPILRNVKERNVTPYLLHLDSDLSDGKPKAGGPPSVSRGPGRADRRRTLNARSLKPERYHESEAVQIAQELDLNKLQLLCARCVYVRLDSLLVAAIPSINAPLL